MSNASRKRGILEDRKQKNGQVNKIGQTESIIYKKTKMLNHPDVKIYCTKNHFTQFPPSPPQNKPHGAHGLGKHYHMRFNTKLGHVTCEIHCITCAYNQ